MGLFELFILACGLSMDAAAVAVCKGLNMKQFNWKQGLLISIFFGGFQAVMPLIGWLLGSQFEMYISQFDHWLAFLLLCFLGVKMIVGSFDKDPAPEEFNNFNIKELFLMSVATSIDALAVGITFAFLKVNILSSVVLIGITTLSFSFLGVFIGYKSGIRFKNKAEIFGGLILIVLGIKILFEHMFM